MKLSGACALATMATLGAFGCASKKYVSNEVGEVNRKADAMAGDLEKTQDRVKRNEVRIDEVGQDTQAVKADAAAAMSKATDAQRAARGKILYTVTLTDDELKFPFGRAEINDEAKAHVSEALKPIVTENRGVFFEIEGHTDSVGPADYNMKLGEKRAEAVRNYLHDEMGVALSRLAVVSYGETQPVIDNKTAEDRAQNRRVVVKVLE